MKILIGVMVAAVVGLALFMMSRLSSDAIGMAAGVLFGMLAGIPSALLVLASSRRRERDDDDDDYGEESLLRTWHQPYQPPVIVLAAPREQQPQTVNNYTYTDNRQVHVGASMPLLADREREVAAQRERRFVVIGEREEW